MRKFPSKVTHIHKKSCYKSKNKKTPGKSRNRSSFAFVCFCYFHNFSSMWDIWFRIKITPYSDNTEFFIKMQTQTRSMRKHTYITYAYIKVEHIEITIYSLTIFSFGCSIFTMRANTKKIHSHRKKNFLMRETCFQY